MHPQKLWSSADVIAVREGAYEALFARGEFEAESLRMESLLDAAFHPDSAEVDPGLGLAFVLLPDGGDAGLRRLSEAIAAGAVGWPVGHALLGYLGLLGAPDALRERVASVFDGVASTRPEALAASAIGGGDLRDYRDHYEQLRRAEASLAGLAGRWPVVVARQWFDFVLARRWSGYESLRALNLGELDPASRWLVSTAEFLAGEEGARLSMIACAEAIVGPVDPRWPRLSRIVAREMAALVAEPFALRWRHLQCAAARDHAAAAVRHWLGATQGDARPEEDLGVSIPPGGPHGSLGVLSPEPTAAARAAEACRQKAGEFLLDWFVQDRAIARPVDAWAADVLRLYHRLRGVVMLGALGASR